MALYGRLMGRIGRGLTALPPHRAFLAGAAAWALGVGGAASLAWAWQRGSEELPAVLGVPLLALALKPCFSWRMLRDEVQAVDAAFAGGLDAARARVAFICSRDTAALDAAGVRETALESLAENLNDALIAPLFWFAVAGLPGAWAWRAANTLDAMWGYRGRWEWAGKWAARADDLGGWIPARLTALLLWRPGVRWAVLRREARRTPSPNGGWPMATLALRLDLGFGKPGVYRLHAGGAAPGPGDIPRAIRATSAAAWSGVVLTGLLLAAAAWAGR